MRGGTAPRTVTLRALIIGGATALVASACVTLAGLLVVTERMRASIDREARRLVAEQQTAAAISREVERQLLDAAAYLNDPRPGALERFHARGLRVYALERGYLFRGLSLAERLQVERVKELHQALEVLAQAAFDARDAGDARATVARAEALFAASEPVQRALDAFLAMRAQAYHRAHVRQDALLRRLYVTSSLVAGTLLVTILIAVRFVHRRVLAPVDALTRAAQRVGAGDLSARVPEGTGDELSQLARSFNTMTAGLATLQTELRESEGRYRRLVELTPDAIVVHDADRILLANPAALRLFGAPTLAELARRPLGDLLPPGAAGRGEDASVERELRRVDGGTVFGEITAAPLVYDGRPASLMVIRDVTARRDAEATLRATEDRLRQAQKMEAIGRLAGGIAHDFNNLLTIILSQTELLMEDRAVSNALQADLADIRAAGVRAASLTRQLLAFSRKQVLQPGSLDVNDVVREVLRLLHRLIASDIEIRTELTVAGTPVRADRGQLEQVILNLALNARDAMPNGGRLTISTSAVTLDEPVRGAEGDVPAGAYVALAVTDTGVGMDDATLRRMFEPFFTTKDVGKGTGLGLATVYGIVRQSGGYLRVDSAPGAGSRVEILLPVAEVAVAAAAPESLSAMPRGHETVLLAEDDDTLRALTARVLSRQGYTVIEARDGADAERIAATRAGRIDLLLTDVVMPGIGGRELARRLVLARPGLKVLFATGYTEDEVLRRGVVAQTHALIEKPYSPRQLTARVREVLDAA